ncbi:septal ring lytic transglycosylase RlpA family protein [Hymenobacter sp. BT175]|uniref:septal ring lytic transglycosylase RlpA family protein n=1 Tax=Hymenobacter translucens TaxID=2886507 RepID=UPI001D0EE208|nr:septal ring lytic transglycosylase RlpA family protein [Hymenobacter translucens]MCC2545977.1 septal ring lytic transglycosylase RlpA family protein [Hymenobacter translucens]
MKLITRLHLSGLLMASLLMLFSAAPGAARALGSDSDDKAPVTAKKATVLRGRASWYGREHQGHRTSNGERFDRMKYTCAHKTLPFGTRLRVTNPQNGKSVVVRVSDRGPFRHQRILDLSEIAARPLDIVRLGAVSVVAEVVPDTTPLGPTDAPADLASLGTEEAVITPAADIPAVELVPTTPEPAPTFVVQAGTFGDPRNAQAVQARIQAIDKQLPVTIAQETAGGRSLSRVLVGQFTDREAAEALRKQLLTKGITGLVRQRENF